MIATKKIYTIQVYIEQTTLYQRARHHTIFHLKVHIKYKIIDKFSCRNEKLINKKIISEKNLNKIIL